ncbi:MAG: hypothetical protein LBN00_06250 [Oscillospiraceae bacterium]|jgi:methyl-accepting chemotaxis protein|nr:hypothetical protein [Oscillospiraceae bacterium]
MADIVERLVLADAFSETFESFINLGVQAAEQASASADAVGYWTDAIGNYDTSALQAMYSTQELVDMGYMTADALEQSSEAASEAAETLDLVTQSSENVAAELDDVTEAADEAAESLDDMGDAAEGAGDDVEKSGKQAEKAADGGMDKLLGKLGKLAAAYVSVRAVAGMLTDGLKNQTYELNFQARFGDEAGSSLMRYVEDTSNNLGRSLNDIAAATNDFTKITTNTENIDKLTNLADRFARFSDKNDFSAVASGLTAGLRSGSLGQISSQTGISTGILAESGVQKALDTGNVAAFTAALEAAAEAAGMTQDAMDKLTSGGAAQWERFTNNIHNGVQLAGRAFINGFGSAFEKMNEWFNSDKGQKFFAALEGAMNVAGQAAAVLVDGLIWVGNFIADNLTTIVMAASIALAIFAGYMLISAASSLIAAWPVLLIVAAVVALTLALNAAGVTCADVFGFIGGLAGGLYAFVYNLIADIWNFIATFAEFFANVFNDPIGSIIRLFAGLADSVLGVIQTIASALDLVFGSNMAGAVQGWRDGISEWVDNNLAEQQITLPRMERMDLADTVDTWAAAGAALGEKVDAFDPSSLMPDVGGLPSIGAGNDLIDVGTVNKVKSSDVHLADEDIKLLVDLAERKYVNQINITQLTPDVKLEVNNNNGEKLDENKIAGALQKILEEQLAMHSDGVYAT